MSHSTRLSSDMLEALDAFEKGTQTMEPRSKEEATRDLINLANAARVPSTREAVDASNALRVDRIALREALSALRSHQKLLVASASDVMGLTASQEFYAASDELSGRSAILGAIHAIEHVLEDDFRSLETRGGS